MNVSEADISDEEMLEYLNFVYHDVFNIATMFVGKSTTWQEYTTDLVAGQREYTLQEEVRDGDEPYRINATRKVLTVSYREAPGWKYKKVRKVDLDSLRNDAEYYNQTGEFWFRADTRSLFIYPIPRVTIIDGLKVTGSYVPFDLLIDDEEIDILLEKQFHQMLLYGFCANVAEEKALYDKATYYGNKYAQFQQTYKVASAEQQEIYDMGSDYRKMDGYLEGVSQFC